MHCECGEPIEPGQKFCIACGRKTTVASSGPDENTSLLQNAVDGTVAVADDSSAAPDDSASTSTDDTIVPDDSLIPPHEAKGKRWRKVVIAIVVILALVLAGFAGFALWGMNGGTRQAEGKDTVRYSDSKASMVRKKTVIVLYDKDGKPLEQYELKVMDADGDVTTHSVKDGQFTPAEVGMKPNKQYEVVVKEPSGSVYSLPKTDVRPDDETSNDIHDDKLDVKPSDNNDSGDHADGSSTCAKQKMYLAFYDVISSLQSKYGEGRVATASGDDDGYLQGLSIVLLVDADGDGEDDELITVHDNEIDKSVKESGWGWIGNPKNWTVQTWKYDAKSGKASNAYRGEPQSSNGGFVFLDLVTDNDGSIAFWDNMKQMSEDDFKYMDYYRIFPVGDQYPMPSGSEKRTLSSGEESLVKSQKTVVAIKQGMMAGCDTVSDASNDSNRKNGKAVKSAFLDKINELQKRYGAGKVVSSGMDSGHGYMTGLCDVRLIDFDQDGTDELVVVYSDRVKEEAKGYDPASWRVEIWRYDQTRSILNRVYSAQPAAEEPNHDLISLTYASGGERMPQILGRDTPSYDNEPPTEIVSLEDGMHQKEYRSQRLKESDGSYTFKYYIDDTEVDSSVYLLQVSSLTRADPNGDNSENAYKRDVLAWNDTSLGFKNDVFGNDVLKQMQNTINELKAKS
ncbi:zinc ribbon domain-containing protein [Bifidobacterium adolescentis]|uniref:zinc ribbon domain-containing protein n=1 Tax=Bifidobacterium adolescentis TaxID=1680 RepID=UPI0004E5D9FB|nr:zinc ribbon domain-containing protein [Bifidobacterium adolescentis]AII76704.1 hypothetical protein BADO_1293 [Bifidobacterium adolescentis]